MVYFQLFGFGNSGSGRGGGTSICTSSNRDVNKTKCIFIRLSLFIYYYSNPITVGIKLEMSDKMASDLPSGLVGLVVIFNGMPQESLRRSA